MPDVIDKLGFANFANAFEEYHYWFTWKSSQLPQKVYLAGMMQDWIYRTNCERTVAVTRIIHHISGLN